MFIWHEHAHSLATLGRQLSLVLSGIAKGRDAGVFVHDGSIRKNQTGRKVETARVWVS